MTLAGPARRKQLCTSVTLQVTYSHLHIIILHAPAPQWPNNIFLYERSFYCMCGVSEWPISTQRNT